MDKIEAYSFLGIPLGKKKTIEEIPTNKVFYSGLAKYIENSNILKKLGVKVDVREASNAFDFFRILNDEGAIVVSKVTTEPNKYSGFVPE